MLITRKERKADDYGEGEILVTTLATKDKTISVTFGHGEPEDNYLLRDLSDAYSIVDMLKAAYEAGKNGEELKVEEVELGMN